jgi:deoxyribose-phosphate aldolase
MFRREVLRGEAVVRSGAREMDMVIAMGRLLAGDDDYVLKVSLENG